MEWQTILWILVILVLLYVIFNYIPVRFIRRTAGSYSFGYEDMNSILRDAHNERIRRVQEYREESSRIDKERVVCIKRDSTETAAVGP